MCDELGIPRPGADGSVDLRGGESAEPMWSALTRKYDIAFIKREGYFQKVPQIVVYLSSITRNDVDADATFQDPSGCIGATIHRS